MLRYPRKCRIPGHKPGILCQIFLQGRAPAHRKRPLSLIAHPPAARPLFQQELADSFAAHRARALLQRTSTHRALGHRTPTQRAPAHTHPATQRSRTAYAPETPPPSAFSPTGGARTARARAPLSCGCPTLARPVPRAPLFAFIRRSEPKRKHKRVRQCIRAGTMKQK